MRPVRIAAAGDVHATESKRAQLERAFAELDPDVDLVLLAGDLTTYGEPEQATIVADAVRGLAVPVVSVLGNHDWHSHRAHDVVDVLTKAGVTVLERSWTSVDVRGTEVGIVGTKGFVGGFPDSQLPDFGEPSLRRVYAETSDEIEAIEAGLQAIAHCPIRIVLLHYAPTSTTLEGEPRTIWAFLGTDRMAPPIGRHRPDLVLHGHGHAGRFEGSIEDVPVFNVAIPVIGRDFWIFELDGRPPSGEG
ncbi:MAG: metallophosphoesterase [Actinobacteria bacterium]|nr:metallophosphoesterase [Actinomycetota bacterium]